MPQLLVDPIVHISCVSVLPWGKWGFFCKTISLWRMFAEARLSYKTILIRRFWFYNKSQNGRSCQTRRWDIPCGLSLLQCQWFAFSLLLQFEISPPLVLEISILVIWWLTEMLVVEELYKEAVVGTNRKLIIFNGELDRIRSGCILQHVWRFPYALVNFFFLC